MPSNKDTKLKKLIKAIIDSSDRSCDGSGQSLDKEKYDGWCCYEIPNLKLSRWCPGCLFAELEEEAAKKES